MKSDIHKFAKAKKSMGQNFLTSQGVVRTMVSAANVAENDTVIEIGPGKGILTGVLLAVGAKVIAVEKDDLLFEYLKDKFKDDISSKNLVLIHSDILHLSVEEIFNKAITKMTPYKLIANIPYNITGEVLRKFLEENNQPTLIEFLVQKEVAKRIVSSDGKESILSISVKAYGLPKYILTVKSLLFRPAPKVDSGVILIDKISKDNFKNGGGSEEKFFQIVRTGFAHKRKMLIGNLKDLFGDKNLEEIMVNANIPLKTRAENLKLSDWMNLKSAL